MQGLAQHLADLSDLHSQVKQAHWNVTGPTFAALHPFFDGLAEHLESMIDTVAERQVTLGHAAAGTVRAAASVSRLPEMPEGFIGQAECINLLTDRYGQVVRTVREAVRESQAIDEATADMFTELLRDLEKDLWMIEAHTA